MVKHYVEFSLPGILSTKYQVKEVAELDSKKFAIPSDAFAYRFFDRSVTIVDGETLFGEKENLSPYFYLGKEYSLEEIKSQFPEHIFLIYNMESNGYTRAIRTHKGNWFSLKDEDIVIS